MATLKENEKKRNYQRSDNLIPDYEYLFDEHITTSGKKKNNFFKKLIAMNLGSIIISTLLYLLQASPTWIMPIVTSNIINIATKAVEIGQLTNDLTIKLIVNISVLAISVLQNVASTYSRNVIASKMLRRTSAGMKSTLIRKLQSLSITYHKDIQTGKIQSKFLKDLDNVDGLFHSLIFFIIPNIIGVIVATAISLYKNGFVSLFFLLIIPCNVFLTMLFRKKIRVKSRNYRVMNENVSSNLTTMLQMVSVTKAHGLEKHELSNVNNSINKLANTGMSLDKTIALFGSASWVVNTLLSCLCLIFCAILAINKIIQVGDIVLYMSMFSSLSGYISGLVGILPQLSAGFEALNSVSEIMVAKDVEVTIGKKDVAVINGNIQFKNVCYKYPNTEQYVVHNFNLAVNKGECIAIVGASGSGKSTLMNLIIGLLVPTSGNIYVDNCAITDFNLSEYRHNISVVPQNSILFAGSIKENITYGLSHFSQEQLDNAIEKANLKQLIGELPEGIDTNVGEHGDKLSGGQKQRVTIARALIRDPKILILDEATSALDNISEYHVQQAISKSIKGRTTFIVAHRLSTIRDADRIVVMENGVAVEIGSYQQLIDLKGKFYQLKQLNDMTMKNAEEHLND